MDDKKFQFNFFFTLRKTAIHSSLYDASRTLHSCCGVGNPFWGKDN
jgi:hypothetical protein